MLSVIIPAYNEEATIARCLAALRDQSVEEDYELIVVVDNCSSDNTAEVAEEYANRVLVEATKSPGRARNLGAKVARGEVLVFVDADTRVSRNLLEEVLLASRTAMAGTCKVFFEGGKLLRLYSHYFNLTTKLLIRAGFPLLHTICAFYWRRPFEEVGGFRDFPYMEDIDLSLKLRGKGKFCFLDRAYCISSGRRFEREGFFRHISRQGLAFLYYLAFGKPWERLAYKLGGG